MSAPVYMFDAAEKPSLPLHKVPLVEATAESLKGYGHLVDDHEGFEIEITRWPAQGWRPVDDGTGDEGGWVNCCSLARRCRATERTRRSRQLCAWLVGRSAKAQADRLRTA